jgi:glycine/D-amino acid oxidase-like deaminating enzyme
MDIFYPARPSEYQRVVAASGLSGHGFNDSAPALGEMLADLVLDERFRQMER